MNQQSLTAQQQAELASILKLTQVTEQQMKELCQQAEAFEQQLEQRLGGSQPKSKIN